MGIMHEFASTVTLPVGTLGVVGAVDGVAIITDADGTLQQYLRGLVKLQGGKHLGVGGQLIAIGAVSVRSAQLVAGVWRISGSGDIWFRQGDVTVVATVGAGSTYLSAGAIELAPVDVIATEGYIAIIRDGTETGNVSITRLL